MQIDHIAIWTNDIERMKEFYERYFLAKTGSKYVNPAKRFVSYFLSFSSGTRLELMQKTGVQEIQRSIGEQSIGYAHLSFATGSEQRVNELTARLKRDAYLVLDGPRHTGDGYYESLIQDPDGNSIEITI
jgi:lactoylglutathione lyase